MNKISKICGIFAVGTMMLSTFFVTSCNSEDDFDFGPDSQYSLAERKMTRSFEGGINDDPTKPDTCYYMGGSASKTIPIGVGYHAVISVSWSQGFHPMNFSDVSIAPANNEDGNLTLTGANLTRSSARWNSLQKIDVYVNSTITIKNKKTNDSVQCELAIETIDDVVLDAISPLSNTNTASNE